MRSMFPRKQTSIPLLPCVQITAFTDQLIGLRDPKLILPHSSMTGNAYDEIMHLDLSSNWYVEGAPVLFSAFMLITIVNFHRCLKHQMSTFLFYQGGQKYYRAVQYKISPTLPSIRIFQNFCWCSSDNQLS